MTPALVETTAKSKEIARTVTIIRNVGILRHMSAATIKLSVKSQIWTGEA